MSAKAPTAWKKVQHEVFWDRDVPEGAWRQGFLAAHRSYFPATLLRLTPDRAVGILGKDAFVSAWPELRKKAAAFPEVSRRLAWWDLQWSWAASGTLGVRPLPEWFSLPRRSREFLIEVAARPGTSIYAAAKALKMPYKRAFEHAKSLVEMGFVRKRLDTSSPRRQQRLYAFSS